MRRELLFTISLLISIICTAQSTAPAHTPASSPDQCRIAFYTRDSVAIQLPDGKPHYASIDKYEAELLAIRIEQIVVMDKWLSLRDDSTKTKKEKDAALAQVTALRKDSISKEQLIAKEHALLLPTYKKVDHVADSIGKAKKVKQVREAADNSAMICPTDQMLMIDITNDVAIAMGVKPKLVKVGIYNMDSLMRLMPGYDSIAEILRIDRDIFEMKLAVMNAAIDQRQHELDSLRPTISRRQISTREKDLYAMRDERDFFRGNELYKLDMNDSLQTKEYRVKFYKALSETHKQYGCNHSYEYARAHADWTKEEAEFIDLNAEIAEKLKNY